MMEFKALAAPQPKRVIQQTREVKSQPKRVRVDFPRLISTDSKTVKALSREFTPLSENVVYVALNGVSYLATYLQSAFNTTMFSKAVTGYMEHYSGFTRGYKKPEELFIKTQNRQINHLKANLQNKLLIVNDRVVMTFDPLDFDFKFTVGNEVREEMVGVERALRQIWPRFTMPTSYKRDENSNHVIRYDDSKTYDTGMVHLSDFNRLRFDDAPLSNDYKPEAYEGLTDRRLKDVYQCVYVDLKLTNLHTMGYNSGINGMEESGSVGQVRAARVTATVELTLNLSFPLEFALWATYATSRDEFVPKVFFDWVVQQVTAINNKNADKPQSRLMPLSYVRKMNEQFEKEEGFHPKARVNEHEFAISSSGRVIWIPQVTNPSEYDRILRESYDPRTGEIKLTSKIPELHNIPLYTDWVNGALAFTNDEGDLKAINLSGCIGLNDISISTLVTKPCRMLMGADITNIMNTAPNSKARAQVEQFFGYGDGVVNEFKLKESINPPEGVAHVYSSLLVMYRYICMMVPKDATLGDVFSGTVTDADNNPLDPDVMRVISDFRYLCEQVYKHARNSKKYAFTTISGFMFRYALIGIYAQKGKYYSNIHREGVDRNAPVPSNEVPETVTVDNLPGLTKRGLLPHQAQVNAQTDKQPNDLIMDVSPGGGKTVMGLIDMVKLLMTGKIKRPIVICPTNLIKEWVSEINRMSEGHVNAIPVSSQTVASMVDNLKYTRRQFVDYIQGAPPNTIIIIGMSFLTLRRDVFDRTRAITKHINYGPMTLRVFPNSRLIRQFNADYVLIDESQRVKNDASSVTKAVKQICSEIPVHRLSSGTLIKNRPIDLPAQFSMINPLILGDVPTFEARYGRFDESGRCIGIAKESRDVIARDIAPYVTRVSKRRQDWGYLMPTIKPQFWSVELTQRQREHYDDILNEAVDHIMSDSKLREMIKNADDDTEGAIIEQLKKHLSPIEHFINAPDYFVGKETPSPDAKKSRKVKVKFNPFPMMKGVTQEDLISPKVKQAIEICKLHFEGGDRTITNPVTHQVTREHFEKQTGKVLIFCYNILVAKHFYKHMSDLKYGVLLYLADANAEDTLIKFKTDPNINVMIASETSLQEGVNLQVASRVIRVQTLWTPGAQEQAMSRVMRPDVRQEYARKEINSDWMITNHTFEVAKVARLISKILENKRLSEIDNPEFDKVQASLPELSMIKMNLDMITNNNLTDQHTLAEYYDAYEALEQYEHRQFVQREVELRNKLSIRLGKPAKDITKSELISSAMVPVHSPKVMVGSKSIFTPTVPGAEPLDHRGLGLIPLAAATKAGDEDEGDDEETENGNGNGNGDVGDDEDEGDDTTSQDLVTYDHGTLVQTEYGFGKISGIFKNKVRVDVPGVGRVLLFKSVVFKPTVHVDPHTGQTNEKNITRLENDFKRARDGITFLHGRFPSGVQPAKVNKELPSRTLVKPPELPTKKLLETRKSAPSSTPMPQRGAPRPSDDLDEVGDVKRKSTTTDDQVANRKNGANRDLMPDQRRPKVKDKVNVDVMVYNTNIVISVTGDPEELQHLQETMPDARWIYTPPFIYRHIRTMNGARNMVKTLENNFDIAPSSLDALMNAAKRINHQGNGVLLQKKPIDFNLRNFIRFNATPSKSPNGIHAYPLIMDGELFLAVNQQTQKPAIRRLAQLHPSGVDPVNRLHRGMMNAIVPNPAAGIRFIENMRKHYNVVGANAAISYLEEPIVRRLMRK